MRLCHGLCERLKVKSVVKPLYQYQNRCSKCEVYYPKTLRICPCCKCLLRTKPHHRKDLITSERMVNSATENYTYGPIYSETFPV